MNKSKLKELKLNADCGDPKAMYEYALETDDLGEHVWYLKKAADGGYIPAMYQYALETPHPEERDRYLRWAALNGYEPAQALLKKGA